MTNMDKDKPIIDIAITTLYNESLVPLRASQGAARILLEKQSEVGRLNAKQEELIQLILRSTTTVLEVLELLRREWLEQSKSE